jgi:hypothetical protein
MEGVAENMFDARAALKELDGQKFRGSDLLSRLKAIRLAHYQQLPIEFSTDDLYMLAVQKKWIHEEAGLLRVQLGSAEKGNA